MNKRIDPLLTSFLQTLNSLFIDEKDVFTEIVKAVNLSSVILQNKKSCELLAI